MSRKYKKRVVEEAKKPVVYDSNIPIFQFLNPNSNTKLSNLKGLDLQDLIILLDDYYIQLRDHLDLDKNATFGLEIECEYADTKKINKELKGFFDDSEWDSSYDSSLYNGIEINSPALKDTSQNWKDLSDILSIVEPLASIESKSGGHIHVGVHALGNNREAWLNFIKLWSVYENIIFRFGYGDYLTYRPFIADYARPISKELWQKYLTFNKTSYGLTQIIRHLKDGKYHAVNFKHVEFDLDSALYKLDSYHRGNTIEFRCPNGSLDAAIWQNNVNLFVKMLYYSRSTEFNDDVVQRRHRMILDRFAELTYYDEIYLEQALELCDILFKNNLDKINFLKQYLKSFEIRNTKDKYPKSPVLTKGKLKK